MRVHWILLEVLGTVSFSSCSQNFTALAATRPSKGTHSGHIRKEGGIARLFGGKRVSRLQVLGINLFAPSGQRSHENESAGKFENSVSVREGYLFFCDHQFVCIILLRLESLHSWPSTPAVQWQHQGPPYVAIGDMDMSSSLGAFEDSCCLVGIIDMGCTG
jgi:hypothetical protein